MGNTILDLNSILFKHLKILSDNNLKGQELNDEIMKADTVNKIAGQIINTGRLIIDAARISDEIELPDEFDTRKKLKKKETKELPAPIGPSGRRALLLNRST